jgi:hypothetical protein
MSDHTVSLEPLSLKTVTVLTDAAMHLFEVAYDEERKRQRTSKAKLAAELAKLDLFGGREHYRDDGEYTPGGDQG